MRTTDVMRRWRRGRRSRGAAFVEALIVLTFLVGMLLCLLYFRSLYSRRVKVARVGRAAALSHAMAGCTGGVTDHVRPDMTGLSTPPGGGPTTSPNLGTVDVPPEGESRASGALDGTGFGGGNFLNPIKSAQVNGTAGARTRRGFTTEGFSANLSHRSHVTCADPYRDGDFGEVFNKVADLFGL